MGINILIKERILGSIYPFLDWRINDIIMVL